jgi:hypothetical protein
MMDLVPERIFTGPVVRQQPQKCSTLRVGPRLLRVGARSRLQVSSVEC